MVTSDAHTQSPASAPKAEEATETAGPFEERWRAARAAWPLIPLPRAAFAERLAELGSGEPVARENDADLYLSLACVLRVPGAVEAFRAAFGGEIAGVIARVDRSPTFVDEARQVIELQLLVADEGRSPRIVGYLGRAPLRRWLRVVVKRAAVKLASSVRRHAPVGESKDDEIIVAGGLAPELAHMCEVYRVPCEEAIREAFRTLSPRERTVLRLYVLDGMTLTQVGTAYKVSHATAARWIASAREALVTRSRKTLMERLVLSPSEFDSVAVLVRSHLEVGVAALLATEAARSADEGR